MLELVDPALQEMLVREGHVTCPLLTATDLAVLRADSMKYLGGNVAQTNDPLGELYTTGFDSSAECRELHKKLADVVQPRLSNLLRNFRLFEAVVFCKPPHSPATSIHMHPPMTASPFAQTLVAWIPLFDATPSQGGLRLVPRTQRLRRYIRTGTGGEYFEPFRQQLDDGYAVSLTHKAGEAVIFENSLLHGANANISDQPRLAIGIAILHDSHRHATYFDQEGTVAVVDSDFDRVQCATMVPDGPSVSPDTIIKRYPAWNEKISLREFQALLALGQHASEDLDPLDTVRGFLPTGPSSKAAKLHLHTLIAVSVRRSIPDVIRRRIYTLFSSLQRWVGKLV